MATKIKHGITEKINKATLAELMHATNIFGRGFGTKKFQLILKAEPRILLDTTMSFPEKIQRVSMIEGMATKTAEQFINQLPVFLLFLAEINLQHKLNDVKSSVNVNNTMNVNNIIKAQKHPLNGQEYIMSGFRDKPLIEKLANVGAEQGNSVKKTTIAVLVKNINENTSKIQEAKRLSIPVLTIDQFIMKYNL
jgi:NAD-dependent DNA ligase